MSAMAFKVGARIINAPLQNASLEDNIKQLATTFPQFRWTRILEADAQVREDGTIVYELVLPPVKING